MRFPTRLLRHLALHAVVLAAQALSQAQAADTPDFSAAEKLLFMTPQLPALKRPTTLRYTYRKSGSHEEGFDDSVGVKVGNLPDRQCCKVQGEFLSGPRRLALPDIEGGDGGNPVTMFFLENDVRTMQRLTKGSQSHFRKQIRMALYNAAKVRDVTLKLRGKDVAGKEVLVSPYTDDPNRPRFEKFARKEYRFWVSDAVPGGVFGIRTQISGEGEGSPPLVVEEMLLEGGQAPALQPAS